MPRKRKRKAAGLGDFAKNAIINEAKAAARKHVLPLIKKHLAAFEKKLGGQLKRVRKVKRKRKGGSSKVAVRGRRRVAVAGSSKLGGSSHL